MSEQSSHEPFEINRDDDTAARTASIVLFCLAGVLPVLAISVVAGVLNYRALQRKKKKFADNWNLERLDSHRKRLTFMAETNISHISSGNLDCPPNKQKRVSISIPPENNPTKQSLHYFNDAFVEEGSLNDSGSEEMKPSSPPSSTGGSKKLLLVQRASSRLSDSSRDSEVKNMIVRMMDLPATSRDHPNLAHDRTKDSTDHVTQTGVEGTKSNAAQTKAIETTWDPADYSGRIQWVGGCYPETSQFNAKLIPNDSETYFGNSKPSTDLHDFDYFVETYKYNGRASIDSNNLHPNVDHVTSQANKRDYFFKVTRSYSKNPLYEEDVYDEIDDDVKKKEWVALQYYNAHGDPLSDRSGAMDEVQETLGGPKTLHRYPGMLDLNKILESEGTVSNRPERLRKVGVDNNLEIIEENNVVPPPSMFCDDPDNLLDNDFVETNSQTFTRPLQTLTAEKNVSRSTGSTNSAHEENKELRESSRKLSDDRRLREEEEKALKYFDDMYRELGCESFSGSEDGSLGRRVVGNSTSNGTDSPGLNQSETFHPTSLRLAAARKSYAHLLWRGYPYQRRKLILSELAVPGSTAQPIVRQPGNDGCAASTGHEEGKPNEARMITRI